MDDETVSIQDTSSRRRFSDLYELDRELGCGATGQVYRALDKVGHRPVAVKCVKRAVFAQVEVEMNLLKQISHQNVIELIDYFEESQIVYVVMELASGGDLCDRVVHSFPNGFSEFDASQIIRKILLACSHLHERGIVHLDLKPDNILFSSPSSDAEIKITDFGFARVMRPEERRREYVGTVQYAAPEVLRREPYDEKADVWSVGIILFILLSGAYPYDEADDQTVVSTVSSLPRDSEFLDRSFLKNSYWTTISEDAKNVLRAFLRPNAEDRISISQALEHAWIRGENVSHAPLSDIVRHMESFNNRRRLRFSEFSLAAPLISLMRSTSMSAAARAVLSISGEGTLTNMEIENIKFERGFQPLITAARSDDPDIQKEAALLFRTLASGDHGASEIVRQGAIQHVVHLLTSVSTEAKIFATDVLILLAEKDSCIRAVSETENLFDFLIANADLSEFLDCRKEDGRRSDPSDLETLDRAHQLNEKSQSLIALVAGYANSSLKSHPLNRSILKHVLDSAFSSANVFLGPSGVPFSHTRSNHGNSSSTSSPSLSALSVPSNSLPSLPVLLPPSAALNSSVPLHYSNSNTSELYRNAVKSLLSLSKLDHIFWDCFCEAVDSILDRFSLAVDKDLLLRYANTLLIMGDLCSDAILAGYILESFGQQLQEILMCLYDDAIQESEESDYSSSPCLSGNSIPPMSPPSARLSSNKMSSARIRDLLAVRAINVLSGIAQRLDSPSASEWKSVFECQRENFIVCLRKYQGAPWVNLCHDLRFCVEWTVRLLCVSSSSQDDIRSMVHSDGDLKVLHVAPHCYEIRNDDWRNDSVRAFLCGEGFRSFSFEVEPLTSGRIRIGIVDALHPRDDEDEEERFENVHTGHHLGQDPHSYGFDSSGAVFHNRRRQRNRDARFGVNSVAGCVLRESCDSGFISSSKNSDDGSSSSASESSNVQCIGFFVDGRLIHEQRIATALRSHSFSPAVSLARDQQLILRLSNLKHASVYLSPPFQGDLVSLPPAHHLPPRMGGGLASGSEDSTEPSSHAIQEDFVEPRRRIRKSRRHDSEDESGSDTSSFPAQAEHPSESVRSVRSSTRRRTSKRGPSDSSFASDEGNSSSSAALADNELDSNSSRGRRLKRQKRL